MTVEELREKRTKRAKVLETYIQEAEENLKKSTIIDQIRWERDVAIQQLNDIGCELGRDMSDIKEMIELYTAKEPVIEVQKTFRGDVEVSSKDVNLCPTCKNWLTSYAKRNDFCNKCGQKILWKGIAADYER